MGSKIGLSAFSLKLIMAALMLLDHLYYYFPHKGFPLWFTCLGRMVAPTFCFLMTQSLVHARDRERYIRRLALAGMVMWCGNFALSALTRYIKGHAAPVTNSIFLSLAIGAAVVDSIERYLCRREASCFARLALCAFLCVFVEGQFLIPALAVIFYFLRERRALMCAVYAVVGSLIVFLLYLPYGPPEARFALQVGGHAISTQYLQVSAIIPIFLYSGVSGASGGVAKWFFYIFYPLHIWVLYLIKIFI